MEQCSNDKILILFCNGVLVLNKTRIWTPRCNHDRGDLHYILKLTQCTKLQNMRLLQDIKVAKYKKIPKNHD